MSEPLLSIQDLKVHFSSRAGTRRTRDVVRAVDGISFDVRAGETLGVVGESGCGKSTTGMAVQGLVEPTAGTIRFDGVVLPLAYRPRLSRC